MIVASFLLASWLGCCIAASPWSDRIGRRIWIIAGNVIQIVGTIVSVTSYSPGQMIAGRVIIVGGPSCNVLLDLSNFHLIGYWQWHRCFVGASVHCRNYVCYQAARSPGWCLDGMRLYRNCYGVLGVSVLSACCLVYTTNKNISDFGFTYASGQLVWRIPVALQVIWSLLSIAFTWPNPGEFTP